MLNRLFFTFLGFLLVPLVCDASDLVDLSVITTKGYVSYTVPGEWKVLDMQTKAPKTVGLFQIKNPADEGTQDSTNLSILTFETNSPEATATFDKMVAKRRAEKATRSSHGAWQVFSRDAMQGKTLYHAREAVRDVPGTHVLITLAWPQLQHNPPRYDAEMQTAFYALLDSVKGGLGPKPKVEGEVIRRPIRQ
jgi:hypothetical protein